MTDLLGGVEAGGTKFILGLRRGGQLLESARIATRDPGTTLAEMADFFTQARARHGEIAALGLATFGPIELDRGNPLFGHIVGTPKPGWDRCNLVSALAECGKAPIAVETDVNAAAYAEGQTGACVGLERFCYVTVGTGIGVGYIEDGAPARAIPHAETGHMTVKRAPGDTFAGICPYHGDCLEGVACGPAMTAHWGTSGSNLPQDHEAWTFEAHYIASLCVNLTYGFRPQRIVLGGGVFNAPFLLERVRQTFGTLINGYAPGPYAAEPATYLATPGLTDPSPGLEGAFLLARSLLEGHPEWV